MEKANPATMLQWLCTLPQLQPLASATNAAPDPAQVPAGAVVFILPGAPSTTETAAPAQVTAGPPSATPSTSSGLPENRIYKNKIQEYTQRSGIPLPIYRTVNEGSSHAPQFRSTVFINGVTYTSPYTFSHRKAAEQDVAKLALEGISLEIEEDITKDQGHIRLLILEHTVFCKSILNEFAAKMNLARPTYSTIQQQEALHPVFTSSLLFNGVSYIGEAGKNKKEAEQLAARAVILSLLGTSGTGTLVSEIIKSKHKLYTAFDKDTSYAHKSPLSRGASVEQINVMPQGASVGQISTIPPGVSIGQISAAPQGGQIPRLLDKGKGVEVAVAAKNVSKGSIPGAFSVMAPLRHEFKAPKPSQPIKIEPSSQATNLPIAFVRPVLQQPLCEGQRSSKKRKNIYNKKLQSDT
ncbi:double-stranded RNA-binding protein 4-like [Corylus avellana]|uniref:double-stranded RNA-binding protein 4-like n=1 Tax=Corylus avellana TaxID=13451 RepID=UPI001E23CF9C|nr:double-stranded RNA-binding protein 4-like [Corylus avellana]